MDSIACPLLKQEVGGNKLTTRQEVSLRESCSNDKLRDLMK